MNLLASGELSYFSSRTTTAIWLHVDTKGDMCFIIRLEDRLKLNIGFTLRCVLAVLTRSAITSLKVNRFGWNLEHSEYIVGGWTWQILGSIRAVVTAGEPSKICFFCQVSNTRCHWFTVGQISRNLNITRRLMSQWKRLEQNFEYFTISGRFSKKKPKMSPKFLTSCDFRPS